MKAFSLIEVIVALLLLLGALLVLAVSFQANIEQTVSAKNGTAASAIADAVLAELSSTNPENWDTNALATYFTFDFNGERITGTSSGESYFTTKIETSPAADGYYDVEIAVSWTGWSGESKRVGMDVSEDEQAFILNAQISPVEYLAE